MMSSLRLTACSLFLSLALIPLGGQTAGLPGQPLAWPEPAPESRPWSRWWWMGSAVDPAGLTRAMESYRDAGLGGLEITVIYGVRGEEERFLPYLSPAWIDAFRHTLGEAERLGLGLDLANASGWPFGGPWIGGREAPKYARLEHWTVAGGESLAEPVTRVQEPVLRTAGRYRPDWSELMDPIARTSDLQAKALDQVRFPVPMRLVRLMAYGDRNRILDLTGRVDTTGRLRWIAPEGTWQLYGLFQGNHGKMVERAGPGGEGNVIDHFSDTALEAFLEPFDTAFAGVDLGPLRGFFNDSYEVDDARGEADWTEGFLEAFRRRRGYDLRDYLPLLATPETGEDLSQPSIGSSTDWDADTRQRVWCDYRETLSDLLLERFTRPWDAWADQYGKLTRNQAHGSPANILDLYAAVDIPEAEGTDILRAKFASSAAHVTGKPLASAEAATWLDQHFRSGLGEVKLALDRFFIAGINHLVYHGTTYAPPDAAWPGWLFYAAVHFSPVNPWWAHFPVLNTYVTRCQTFLQRGAPHNDVLLYFPIHDRWSEPGPRRLQHYDGFDDTSEDWPARRLAEAMQEQGYAFDLVSDRQLDLLRVEEGQVVAPGARYRAIVVPRTAALPLATFQRLLALAESGATVTFQEALPARTAGLGGYPETEETYQALRRSLAEAPAASDAGPCAALAEEGGQCLTVGRGKVILAPDLTRMMAAAGVARETLSDGGLQFIRRVIAGDVLYFLHNPGTEAFEGSVELVHALPNVARLDPMSGRVGLLPAVPTGTGGMRIPLQLPAGGSVLLSTAEAPFAAPGYPDLRYAGESMPLEGPVRLEARSGGPALPAARELDAPTMWTDLADPAYERFSGIASYTFTFDRPDLDAEWLELDLGRVAGSVEVLLNGERLGTLLGPTYRLRLPAPAWQARNTLELRVANTMANRIAWMDREGMPWKKFYNINFSSRNREDVGPDGVFSAAQWTPMASGLAGPVRWRALRSE